MGSDCVVKVLLVEKNIKEMVCANAFDSRMCWTPRTSKCILYRYIAGNRVAKRDAGGRLTYWIVP